MKRNAACDPLAVCVNHRYGESSGSIPPFIGGTYTSRTLGGFVCYCGPGTTEYESNPTVETLGAYLLNGQRCNAINACVTNNGGCNVTNTANCTALSPGVVFCSKFGLAVCRVCLASKHVSVLTRCDDCG